MRRTPLKCRVTLELRYRACLSLNTKVAAYVYSSLAIDISTVTRLFDVTTRVFSSGEFARRSAACRKLKTGEFTRSIGNRSGAKTRRIAPFVTASTGGDF